MISMPPHLQEFLKSSQKQEEPVASSKNFFGALVEPLLEYRPKEIEFKCQDKQLCIRIQIPQNLGKKNTRGNIFISTKNEKQITKQLQKVFDEIFFNYVQDKIRSTNQIKATIENFIEHYNIPLEHISFDSLKKKYYRQRLARIKPNSFAQNVTP